MTLEEAKKEMLKFVKMKTTMMPVFASVIMEQAEPVKHGRWVETQDDCGLDACFCSVCEDTLYQRPIDPSWYYCPHCGAKMDLEEYDEAD